MIYVWIAALIILIPVAAYLFNGKDRGNIWLGVKYAVGLIIALALFFVLFHFLGIWSVLVFPVLLFVLLFVRKYTNRKSDNSPLDDFRSKH